MNDFNYTRLLNCKTPEDVKRAFVEWSSNKSEQEHLIRSSILDLHAIVEQRLKKILYEVMLDAMPFYEGEVTINDSTIELEKVVSKMNFASVYKILKPCLFAFVEPDVEHIESINQCRNQVTHGNIENVRYKGNNPFTDSECLAQFYFECWAVRKSLRKFLDRMILDARVKSLHYEEYYWKQKEKGHEL